MADANKQTKPSFIKRHHRSLSFFSLLIAVALYVVNEDIRESMKELTDEITSAQSTFEIRGDITKLQERIDHLASPTPAIASNDPSAQRTDTKEADVVLDRIESDIGKVRSQLTEVAELQERLGMSGATDEMKATREQLDNLNSRRIQIAQDMHTTPPVDPGGWTPLTRANLLFLDSLSVQQRATDITESTLAAARIYKVGHEYLYTLTRRIGFGFFVLGLILNFFVEGTVKSE